MKVSANWKQLQKVLTKLKIEIEKEVEVVKKQMVEPVSDSEEENYTEEELEQVEEVPIEEEMKLLDQILENETKPFDMEQITKKQQTLKRKRGEKVEKQRVISQEAKQKIGKYLALDCEMVGVGPMGSTSVLARISIVNFHGEIVLDEYVLPQEHVIDYRTAVSGITPKLLKEHGKPFKEVQKKVSDILKNKIIIGHALKNDLDALMLDHPRKLLRDTSRYKPLKNPTTKGPQSLKKLAKQFLEKDIQTGQHSSVEDARIALQIYQLHRKEWEQTMYRSELLLKPHSW